ncbi:MAG: type III secretion system export apparatus subunit SctS [Limnobacter sp.]|uniref:type III secretion system export apparatus subunit SctS n=1 Tax=unclassified Limnobacter TaxID=2630203 RepID=UPI000C4188BB|nr:MULTISPECIES: type III secretion system export apparatus subunit SctS [unclassified Limnobacter]MAG81709.1 EscS/YscS/HrcS family type III secretion system export apparatus protein [Sutterellaceae bacterium]MBA4315730.1 EscS/YscS/HrcS family type III secretion system export apparatus protein [Alcaligenaceae bacterium]PZO17724.1 MAG: EscS/YscS/HrcS family type III secretion system export apparatus protein [Betaproteobacteria bacterium]MBT84595.1 EscS/YscS/HrcS family type III secretion system 
MITNFVSQALWISLLVSLPVVGITVVLGFILGFLQAIFQLQDQALPFGIKLVACVACLIMLGPWIAGMMMQYTNQIFEIISMSAAYG